MDYFNTPNFQYLVIGNGRMAKHFIYYLKTLNLDYYHWHRANKISDLKHFLKSSTHILLLINDGQIDPFIETNLLASKLSNHLYIHFSGALISKYAYTAHPLQTFSNRLYSPESYLDIPFAIEKNGPNFNQLLPGIANRHFKISRKDKPYYHALGAIANNYTTLLWQKYFDTLKNHFNIDPKLAIPLLEQTLTNLKNDYQHALTGPIARGDIQTINNHIHALEKNDDNYLQIYNAFVNTHCSNKETEIEK